MRETDHVGGVWRQREERLRWFGHYIQQFMDIMSKENSRDRDENNMEVDVFISRWLSEKKL